MNFFIHYSVIALPWGIWRNPENQTAYIYRNTETKAKLQKSINQLPFFKISKPILFLKGDQPLMMSCNFLKIFLRWSKKITKVLEKWRSVVFHVKNEGWQEVYNAANQYTHFCSFTMNMILTKYCDITMWLTMYHYCDITILYYVISLLCFKRCWSHGW